VNIKFKSTREERHWSPRKWNSNHKRGGGWREGSVITLHFLHFYL